MAGKRRKDRITQEHRLFVKRYGPRAAPCQIQRPRDWNCESGSKRLAPEERVRVLPGGDNNDDQPWRIDPRAIVVTLCSVLCACGLVMDSSFDTLREALDSDMVNKGWIPGWVPQAATDLRRYMTSTRTPARWPSPNPLRYHCSCLWIARQRHSVAAILLRSIDTGGRATGRSSRRTASRCAPESGKSVFVAINRTEDHVLFWRTYAR